MQHKVENQVETGLIPCSDSSDMVYRVPRTDFKLVLVIV